MSFYLTLCRRRLKLVVFVLQCLYLVIQIVCLKYINVVNLTGFQMVHLPVHFFIQYANSENGIQPYCTSIHLSLLSKAWKIVAAFWGMHLSPAKHSYAWLPRKCDYWTDRQTDAQTEARQSDPYVSLCFAGGTKITPQRELTHLVLKTEILYTNTPEMKKKNQLLFNTSFNNHYFYWYDPIYNLGNVHKIFTS